MHDMTTMALSHDAREFFILHLIRRRRQKRSFSFGKAQRQKGALSATAAMASSRDTAEFSWKKFKDSLIFTWLGHFNC